MQTNLLDLKGAVLRTIDLDDRVFGITPNEAVVHQAVVAQQANARHGTHDTKTRGEVAGGGKKPYRQKGTGYARQGSRRSPHYRGGGIIFGPHPRSYHKDLPRKMRRLAIRSVLSARAAEQALTVVERFEVTEGRTRVLLEMLSALGAADGAVVVVGERNDQVLRAARNLERVHVVTPNGLNLLDMLRLPRLVLTEAAVALLTQTLTRDLKPEAQPEGATKPARSRSRAGARQPAEGEPVAEAPTPRTRRARASSDGEPATAAEGGTTTSAEEAGA